VEQTISRRLRLLSPAQRRLIHLAAIVGEHVDFDVLRAVCESEPQTMLAAVRELVRYRFLDETLRDYRFSHDKVRQVAYADIDAPARLTLHRQVAQIIETLHPEQVVVLAHHWTQAEGWEQAADYYRQAGDQARAVYANTDAVAHYTQALAALAHLPDTAKQKYAVLLGREAVYDLMGKREAQAEDLATMAALAEGLDANQQGELALRQANHAEVTNNFSVAIATAQQAIRLGQIAQEAGLETSGQLLWGKALWRQGEFDAACAHFEQALALARYAAFIAWKPRACTPWAPSAAPGAIVHPPDSITNKPCVPGARLEIDAGRVWR
jgi:predicted ATPase